MNQKPPELTSSCTGARRGNLELLCLVGEHESSTSDPDSAVEVSLLLPWYMIDPMRKENIVWKHYEHRYIKTETCLQWPQLNIRVNFLLVSRHSGDLPHKCAFCIMYNLHMEQRISAQNHLHQYSKITIKCNTV